MKLIPLDEPSSFKLIPLDEEPDQSQYNAPLPGIEQPPEAPVSPAIASEPIQPAQGSQRNVQEAIPLTEEQYQQALMSGTGERPQEMLRSGSLTPTAEQSQQIQAVDQQAARDQKKQGIRNEMKSARIDPEAAGIFEQAYIGALSGAAQTIPKVQAMGSDINAVVVEALTPEWMEKYLGSLSPEVQRSAARYYRKQAQGYSQAGEEVAPGFTKKLSEGVTSAGLDVLTDLALTAGTGTRVQAGKALTQSATTGAQLVREAFLNPRLQKVAALGGARGGLSTLGEATDQRVKQGLTPEEAQSQAIPEAALSGLSTYLLTALGGFTGAEAVLQRGGKEAFKRTAKEIIKELPKKVVKESGKEVVEETTDQAFNDQIERFYRNPDKAIEQSLKEMRMAALTAMFVSGGINTLGGIADAIDAKKMQAESPLTPDPNPEVNQIETEILAKSNELLEPEYKFGFEVIEPKDKEVRFKEQPTEPPVNEAPTTVEEVLPTEEGQDTGETLKTPVAEESETITSAPAFISKAVEQQLADLGYPRAEINKLKPVDAQTIIKEQRTFAKPVSETITESQPRIESTALKFGDKIVKGEGIQAHADLTPKALEQFIDDPDFNPDQIEYGFIDSEGNFKSRSEAEPIAVNAGQVREGYKPEGNLQSQDLLNTPVKPPTSPVEASQTEKATQTQPEQQQAFKSPTGIKNAQIEKERAAKGLPPRIEPLRKSFGKSWDEAMAKVDKNPAAGTDLVESVLKEPRATNDVENALLLHEKVVRETVFNNAVDKVNNAADDTERSEALAEMEQALNKVNEVNSAADVTGTLTARGLSSRRMMVNDDFTLARMVSETQAIVNQGKPLSDKQFKEVQEAHAKIADLEKRIAELEEKELDRQQKDVFATLLDELKKDVKSQRKTKEGRKRFFEDAATKARERRKKDRGNLNVGLDPVALVDYAIIGADLIEQGARNLADFTTQLVKEYGEAIRKHAKDIYSKSKEVHEATDKLFTPDKKEKTPQELAQDYKGGTPDSRMVYEMAKGYVANGIEGVTEVINTIHKELSTTDPDLTVREVRDAFSGYNTPRTTKKQDQNVVREYKSIARLLSKLEDAEKGIRPAKGKKTTINPVVKDLQNQIRRALEKAGLPAIDPETRLEARKKAIQTEINKLEQKIRDNDYVIPEKRDPLTDDELIKLQFEREKVKEKYLEGLFQAQLAQRSRAARIWDTTKETFGTLRAVMTGGELSAVLRQGGWYVMGHPIKGLKATVPMLKAFRSEANQYKIDQEIKNNPYFPMAKQAKVFFSDYGSMDLRKMEENYMSRTARKIPLIAGSQRAYSTFLNKIRMDQFESLVKSLGQDGKVTKDQARAIAAYVNVSTGRGDLKAAEKALVGMNLAFFAPSYTISRFQMLLGYPLWRGLFGKEKAGFKVRALIAKEYARSLIGLSIFYSMAVAASDAFDWDMEIEKDPRSPDFGKLRFGNIRLDPLMGLEQVNRFLWKEVTGTKKTARGKVQSLTKENPGPFDDTRLTVGLDFLRTKLAPVPGAAVNLLQGRNLIGEKTNVTKEALNMAFPITWREIYQTIEEEGAVKAAVPSALSFLGMGMQTYDPNKKKD